jgi:hypothetical protein
MAAAAEGNGDSRKRSSDAQFMVKAAKVLKDNETVFQQLADFRDKTRVVLEEDQKDLADEAMGLAKALHEHDGSFELVEELLRTAKNYDTERFEKDLFEFPDFVPSILPDCSDESIMRLIEHLDPSKAERVAPSLGDQLLQRKILEEQPLKKAVDLLEKLTPEVLVHMSGCQEVENKDDREKKVLSIHAFCPEDIDILDELIGFSTDQEKAVLLKKKAKLLIKRGTLQELKKHVDDHKDVDFSELFALDLCEELAQHTDLSKSIRGTLAVAFHSVGKPKEALEQMFHSLDYHLLTPKLKEEIIVDMVKHTSQQDAKLQDVLAQLKELQETVKELESEVKSGKNESGDEAQRRKRPQCTRNPHCTRANGHPGFCNNHNKPVDLD